MHDACIETTLSFVGHGTYIDVTIERVTMIYITYDLRETRTLIPHIMKQRQVVEVVKT